VNGCRGEKALTDGMYNYYDPHLLRVLSCIHVYSCCAICVEGETDEYN
jgi:hypothetical protein